MIRPSPDHRSVAWTSLLSWLTELAQRHGTVVTRNERLTTKRSGVTGGP